MPSADEGDSVATCPPQVHWKVELQRHKGPHHHPPSLTDTSTTPSQVQQQQIQRQHQPKHQQRPMSPPSLMPDEETPLLETTVASSSSSCLDQSRNGHSSGHGDPQSKNLHHAERNISLMRQISRNLAHLIQGHTGSIGYLGSLAIAVNSLTGPAMLNLPATFARSGVIPTVATMVFVCILSALCSLHVANTISKIPGNSHFRREIEYSQLFREYWGRGAYFATEVLFFCCITCLNISSIVDTAQVIDTFLGRWWPWGGVAALQVTANVSIEHRFPVRVGWVTWDYADCFEDQILDGTCIPFQGVDGLLVTMGTVLTSMIFLPLALLDLKDNSHWQIVGFILLIGTSLQFIVQFVWYGLEPSNISWWGDNWDDLFGVVLFNFALVIAIPAWLYEREPHVNVPTIIHGSSILSTVLYLSVGLLGSMALPNVSENMLESMMSGALGTAMQLGASVFAFAIIGLGIPLFSVLNRLNLTGSGLVSQRVGIILSVYLPFSISWLVYNGKSVTKLLSWGGVIFTSLIAFILPLALAMYVVNHLDHQGFVRVYAGWFTSRRAQLVALRILMALAVTAIIAALLGNFLSPMYSGAKLA